MNGPPIFFHSDTVVQAAYAVWTYCYQSAARLFGLATGEAIADRIREAVEASPKGLSRSQISRLFYGHVNSQRIDAALEQLAEFGALAAYTEQTSGRTTTLWLGVQQQRTADILTENEWPAE